MALLRREGQWIEKNDGQQPIYFDLPQYIWKACSCGALHVLHVPERGSSDVLDLALVIDTFLVLFHYQIGWRCDRA